MQNEHILPSDVYLYTCKVRVPDFSHNFQCQIRRFGPKPELHAKNQQDWLTRSLKTLECGEFLSVSFSREHRGPTLCSIIVC